MITFDSKEQMQTWCLILEIRIAASMGYCFKYKIQYNSIRSTVTDTIIEKTGLYEWSSFGSLEEMEKIV